MGDSKKRGILSAQATAQGIVLVLGRMYLRENASIVLTGEAAQIGSEMNQNKWHSAHIKT